MKKDREEQLVPNNRSIFRTRSSTISSAMSITLKDTTTMIEVHAENQ